MNMMAKAAEAAHADGKLSAEERAIVDAFNWQGLIAAFLPFLSFIPNVGPVLSLLPKLLPYLIELLTKLPNGGGGGSPDPN